MYFVQENEIAMKSIIFIITFLLFLLYPQQYFASIHVFVDPGHGGCDITTNNCGTNTYINNPDTSDCCTLYCEKHINLEVGLALKYCLDNPPGFGFPYIWSYEYSRLIDTSYTPAERAAMANTENAEYLISIHHNRSADTAKQYTVVLYSDNELTSCTHTPPYLPRDHDSTLAVKLGYRLERFLGIYLHADSPWNTTDSFSVLCRSLMPSALTEACFISQPSMADKYFNSAQTGQDYLEALALWTGLTSTILGQGFGRVEYRYWGQDINFNESPPPIVCVDTCEWGERTEYELPYLSCWLEGEEIWLQLKALLVRRIGYTAMDIITPLIINSITGNADGMKPAIPLHHIPTVYGLSTFRWIWMAIIITWRISPEGHTSYHLTTI